MQVSGLDAFGNLFAAREGSAAEFHVFHAHGAFRLHVQLFQAAVLAVDLDDRYPRLALLADAQLPLAVGSERNVGFVLAGGAHLVAVGQTPLQGVQFLLHARLVLIVVPINVYGVLGVELAVDGIDIVADDVLVQASCDVKQTLGP